MLTQTRQANRSQDDSMTRPDISRVREAQTILKLDQTTPYLKNFRVDGNVLQFVGSFQKLYSQALLEQSVPRVPVYSFAFRIKHSAYKYGAAIFIGVTRRKYNNFRNSQFCNDVFSYFGKKHLVFPGKIEFGNGFNLGDEVKVRIDRIQGRIEWYVNGKFESAQNNTQITKETFVPFVQMNQPGDKVEYLGGQQEF